MDVPSGSGAAPLLGFPSSRQAAEGHAIRCNDCPRWGPAVGCLDRDEHDLRQRIRQTDLPGDSRTRAIPSEGIPRLHLVAASRHHLGKPGGCLPDLAAYARLRWPPRSAGGATPLEMPLAPFLAEVPAILTANRSEASHFSGGLVLRAVRQRFQPLPKDRPHASSRALAEHHFLIPSMPQETTLTLCPTPSLHGRR